MPQPMKASDDIDEYIDLFEGSGQGSERRLAALGASSQTFTRNQQSLSHIALIYINDDVMAMNNTNN